MRHDSNDHRRAKRRLLRFFDSLVIHVAIARRLLQQLTKALKALFLNNMKAPGLERAVIRRAHAGAQNIIQRFARRRRLG